MILWKYFFAWFVLFSILILKSNAKHVRSKALQFLVASCDCPWRNTNHISLTWTFRKGVWCICAEVFFPAKQCTRCPIKRTAHCVPAAARSLRPAAKLTFSIPGRFYLGPSGTCDREFPYLSAATQFNSSRSPPRQHRRRSRNTPLKYRQDRFWSIWRANTTLLYISFPRFQWANIISPSPLLS